MSEVTDQENNSLESKLDLTNMTREEALEYMGLPSDADIKEIDDRFWQMSKNYRGKDDPESKAKDDEISAVYDIASGRRDFRVKEEQVRESEPKHFGKTKAEWKTYFEYTWYKYLLGVVIAAAVIYLGVTVFTSEKSAVAVIVFGHMTFDDDYMRDALVDAGAKNPFIGSADIVVPNNEGFKYSESDNAKFNAMFYMDPCVLIADEATYPYYYSTFKDLSPLYDDIMAGLSEEAKAGIVPIYMTEQESMYYQNILISSSDYDDSDLYDTSLFSDEPILIGFQITDPKLAEKLGVDCMWHSRQTTLIVGEYSKCRDDDKTVMVITTIINSAFEEAA